MATTYSKEQVDGLIKQLRDEVYSGRLYMLHAQKHRAGGGDPLPAVAASGHTIYDGGSALPTEAGLGFEGSGIKAIDNPGAGRTDVYVGAYYDCIVDSNDTEAAGMGANVYATVQAAITAGRTSIFLRACTDAADIVISNDATTEANNSTAVTARSMTRTGAGWTKNQWVGHVVTLGAVTGTVINNSTTVLNIGRWSGATPANGAYTIAAIPASSGGADAVTSIIGENPQTALVPVNLTVWKSDFTIQNVQFFSGAVAKTLSLGGVRDLAFACVFVGALNSPQALLNGAITNVATTVAFNTGTNGGMAPMGHARVENEVFAYRGFSAAGGSGVSGTVDMTNVNQRGYLETLNEAHANGSTVYSLMAAHLEVNAADCEVLECRFVGCTNTNAQLVMLRATALRARIVQNRFLSNTPWSTLVFCPDNSLNVANPNGPFGVAVNSNVWDGNTPTSALIEVWNANDNMTTGHVVTGGFAGNLIRGFDGVCMRLFGALWNIAGNTIQGGSLNSAGSPSANTQQFLVNKVGGWLVGDTTLPYTVVAAKVGTLAVKTLLLTDTGELILAWNDGAGNFVNCVRGWNGTVAAASPNGATITNYGQRAIQSHPGAASISSPNLLSGNSVSYTTIVNLEVTVESSGSGLTVGLNAVYVFTTNIISNNTITFGGTSMQWIDNYSSTAFDCQSKAGIAITGLVVPSSIINTASDTRINGYKIVEVDFGSTPVFSAAISVTDSQVYAYTRLSVVQSGIAATGRQADENEMDAIAFSAIPAVGSYVINATPLNGPVVGKYKVLVSG